MYHVPLYPVIPVLGILSGVFIIVATLRDSFGTSMAGLAITILGLPVYFYCNKKRTGEPLELEQEY